LKSKLQDQYQWHLSKKDQYQWHIVYIYNFKRFELIQMDLKSHEKGRN